VAPATGAAPLPALELDRFLPYRVSVLANTTSATLAAVYAERFALTIPEWRVVAVLGQEPGLSAAEVAARTAMDKVAVSRAVAALTRARRVEQEREATDLRRSRLRLTARGLAVYRDVVPFAHAYQDALLHDLTPAERRTLDRLLDRLLDRARTLRGARPAVTDVSKEE
jgi:DNA-binding MarR family transcriptional regulator